MIKLLVDFGASRVKAAICDDAGNIVQINSYSAAEPQFGKDKRCEVSLDEIRSIFIKVLEDYESFGFESIYICSEMHGFIIADADNVPLSNYISWKDERSLNPYNNTTYYDYLSARLGDSFRAISGMRARECFPIFNLFAELQSNPPKQDIKILCLPDYFSNISGKSLNLCHSTMAAGIGFYDIFKQEYNQDFIVEAKGDFKHVVLFNRVCNNIEISGFYEAQGKSIPIYCGVGDHQCAVFGAGNDEKSISFNLGTGSQISIVSELPESLTDVRPFFGNTYLHTVTHIPSGRAFLEYVGFIESICQNTVVWDKFNNLSMSELEKATLTFDLAIFGSAANFNQYQGIGNIREKSLTLENYLASLLKSYAEQYLEILNRFTINHLIDKIILSGGVAHKISVLQKYFTKHSSYQVVVSDKIEETLSGLVRLSIMKQEEK